MSRANYSRLRRMAEHHLDGLKQAARKKDFSTMRRQIASIKSLTGQAFDIVMSDNSMDEDEAESYFKELGRISRAAERYERVLGKKTMNDMRDPKKKKSGIYERAERRIAKARYKALSGKYTNFALREGPRLEKLKDQAISTDQWTYAAYKAGYELGRANNWADMKSLLTYLRENDEQAIANHVQKGAKTGAEAARQRDPSRRKPKTKRKARKMKASHPMRPYFAWVKKNWKQFQKRDGRLDMKRMWAYWKKHHA